MSIGVQSYPELYTMLLGWNLYDKIWNLLTETGIAYLPFLGLIFRTISQSYLKSHHGAEFGLRNLEVNFIGTLLLIFFVVAPVYPLDVQSVSYTPMCGVNAGNTYTPGNTGTTYDKAFAVPTDSTLVPLWWYAVISVSEGMTSAGNTLVGCVPDLRKMVTEVEMTQIQDPETKSELQDFETMCYMPARTQYLADKNNNTDTLSTIQNDLDQYGNDDTEWLGSHSFNDVYYKNINATRSVPGFQYDASQDLNSDTNSINPPTYGNPNCYDWWNDVDNGLKNKLYEALPKTFSDEFSSFINDDATKDNVIKKIISNANSGYSGYDNANNNFSSYGYSHVASALGTWFSQLEEYPKLYAAGQAAPIIQALLLLLIFVFLPFALVFSSYRVHAFISASILIFSVIFWSFIWHLVSWTDASLMQALYSSWFAEQGAGATLADMIIGTLVIFAPLGWFFFMKALGVAAGDFVSGIMLNLNKLGETSGRTVGGAAKGAATNTASTVGKMMIE